MKAERERERRQCMLTDDRGGSNLRECWLAMKMVGGPRTGSNWS